MCNMFGLVWSTRWEILLKFKPKEEWVMAMDVDPTTADSKRISKPGKAVKRFAGSGAEDISETVGKMADILQAENLPNIKWKYSPEPKEQHNTIFRATKEKAIIWTFNKTD